VEKWLPFLGLHSVTSEFQTSRIHTKIKTFILTNTTCTRKSDTVFQFRDIPSKKYITPSLPGQNTHPTKQYVLFMLDQGLQNHTWMLIHVQSASVCQMNFFICQCTLNHLLDNNFVILRTGGCWHWFQFSKTVHHERCSWNMKFVYTRRIVHMYYCIIFRCSIT